ncbi:MAG: DUF4349 domain-containing protein [Treponema sp.]|nr:DUF4349 domain-containing protein [Treponema sp.]
MKKKYSILALAVITVILIFGCSRQSSQEYEQANPLFIGGRTSSVGLAYDDSISFARTETPAFRDMSNLYGRARDQSEGQNNPPIVRSSDSIDLNAANPNESERKLVRTANIRMRVENLETADLEIANLLEKYNAYSASSNIDEFHYFYSLRVPSHLYSVFLNDLTSIGRQLSRNENTDDVTLRYYDLEGRLESRRELLRTFQSYLRRANNIEEILSVEARIADLQRDIDNTGTQLRNLGNMVDYATIQLTMHGSVTTISNSGNTFGERIKLLFNGFGSFLSTIAIILLGIIVYGIPSLALLILFYWVFFGKIGLARKLWGLVRK